jgi:hypothetical protein
MSVTTAVSFGALTAMYTVIVKLRNAFQTWNTRVHQVHQARLQQSLDKYKRVCDKEDMCRTDVALQKTVQESGFRLLQSCQALPLRSPGARSEWITRRNLEFSNCRFCHDTADGDSKPLPRKHLLDKFLTSN